ncbi:PQQ-dependent sugar dehydrogenase [Xanthocytophaga flavus]|uniref:PQQ-dependent sugar dehydrogenase n=1 Tax=Xanthocytophaga flava TaxID=3048013 RepID=UPI0028D2C464|nr:PQQ-dependent sugar dehydrogenase [Xanthocytophaga flavus]
MSLFYKVMGCSRHTPRQLFSTTRIFRKSFYLLIVLSVLYNHHTFAQLPTGFTAKKLTADNIREATAMAHAPDGRIFIAERAGIVKVFQNNTVSTVHTVSTTTASEQGLLGITLHPNFTQNGKCYIFYTNAAMTLHYLDVIVINASNQVTSVNRVMEFDPIINGFHNGGALLFKNGLLYIAIGESNSSAESAKLDTYRGKILRLTEDGQPAPGNPYYNEAGASRQKRSIWAIGMRNPWRMSLDPLSQKIFVMNVGGNYEEIDDVTNPDPAKNYNYGWDQNGRSGPEQPANTITAAFYYGHSNWGCAITSGTFFNPTSTNYPAQYRNRFYFTDWCSGWMRSIDAANPVQGQWQEFAPSGFGSILGTSVGIDGNIYYFKYGNTGSLWRLEYDNTQVPVIVNQPTSQTITAGDPVTFTVSASGATPFTYQWQKNAVNIAGATSASYTISVTTLADAASYRCIVTNANGSATSNNATLTIQPFNAKPVADITLPLTTTKWSVGDVINYAGTATDQEDGNLPASALSWEVRFFHKDSPTSEHWHPGPVVPSGVTSGSFVADNGGETSPNIWLRIILTATDANGRKGQDSVDVYPNKVDITAVANIPGLQVVLAAQGTTPFTKTLVVNSLINLQAITPQVLGNNNYAFSSWTHGGQASQTIRVPAVNTTYTANYAVTSSIQNPYGGLPWSVPGKIEAEDFDTGGQSIAYNDLSTGNSGNGYRTTEDVDIEGCSEGGFNIGWVATGEWLEYTVNITSAGVYTLQTRIATTGAGKTMHIELDGQNISGTINVPNTGGFQSWQTVSVTTPALTVGTKVLRVVFESNDINLNYIAFTSASGNNLPSVSLATTNTIVVAPGSATLTATASDTDGSITKVVFYNGTTPLTTITSAPYTYTWTNISAGTYTLTAQATDNTGATSTSSPVTLTIVSNGASNLALNKKTTTSSTENGSLLGAKAVDGNTGTRWSSAFSDPQWIYVDLGAVYSINRVKITWENARAVDYELQISNDTINWQSLKAPIVGNTQLINDHTGLNGTGRYIRIYGTKRSTQYGYSIYELEVYGTSSSARIAMNEGNTNNLITLYPNPSSGQVTIQYTINQSGPVTLALYSGQGNRTVLLHKNMTKGQYTVGYDLSKHAAGIYFIQLESGGQVTTQKLIKN